MPHISRPIGAFARALWLVLPLCAGFAALVGQQQAGLADEVKPPGPEIVRPEPATAERAARAALLTDAERAILGTSTDGRRLDEEEKETLRRAAKSAMFAGDYRTMIVEYQALVSAGNAELDDWLWLGHAFQLDGKWRQAVSAYKRVMRQLEPKITPFEEVIPSKRQPDHQRWAELVLLIGRLEAKETADADGAIKTWSQSLRFMPGFARPIAELASDGAARLVKRASVYVPPTESYLWFELISPLASQRELAMMYEQQGNYAAALECWTRVRLGSVVHNAAMAEVNPLHVAALYAKQPATGPTVQTPILITCTPENRRMVIRPARGESRLAWWGNQEWNTFAIAPPPGFSFASLALTAKITQRPSGAASELTCWLGDTYPHSLKSVRLLTHRWVPGGDPELQRNFKVDVPYAADGIFFEFGDKQSRTYVREVVIDATLRARGEMPPQPTPPAGMNTLLRPEGGRLLIDGRPGVSQSAKPGPHHLRYEHPSERRAVEFDVILKPGRNENISIDLLSPFTPRQLPGLEFSHPFETHAECVTLPDGRLLMAFASGSAQRRHVMLSSSYGGASWETPWEFTHNSVFNTAAPSMIVDNQGVIWMIVASQRLDAQFFSSGGYQLWLTSSRDGRTWSALRPLDTRRGANPAHAAQLTQDRRGNFWIFGDGQMGSAVAPENLRRLDPISLPGEAKELYIANPHATFDDKGDCHLVFDHGGQAIYYTRSSDMRTWTTPRKLVEHAPNSSASNPQMLLEGERAVLLYETNSGAFLRRGMIKQNGIEFGEDLQFINHWIPLSGGRMARSGASVFLPAGQRSAWLLTAPISELLGLPAFRSDD